MAQYQGPARGKGAVGKAFMKECFLKIRRPNFCEVEHEAGQLGIAYKRY